MTRTRYGEYDEYLSKDNKNFMKINQVEKSAQILFFSKLLIMTGRFSKVNFLMVNNLGKEVCII